VQVVYEQVKHLFWLAGNSVLCVAQYTDVSSGEHRYIHWPRERFCWFKDEKMVEVAALDPAQVDGGKSGENRWSEGMTDPKYIRPGLPFAVGKAVEELGELQAALGKVLRWGWLSTNPELPYDKRESNLRWVRREMKDVRDALDNLDKELDAAEARNDFRS
jgi:hypothetical protein